MADQHAHGAWDLPLSTRKAAILPSGPITSEHAPVGPRLLVDPPVKRQARKRTLPTVRSPAPVFLGFARAAYDESKALPQTSAPAERWLPLERRIRCLHYALAALEAHVAAVHQTFFAQELSTRQVSAWRQRPLLERLSELLPRRLHSARRQRLLRDVLELERVIRQPPPLEVAEQIDLFERSERPSGVDFWFGRAVWVRRPTARDEEEGHRPAALPRDPLELDERGLVTALLVVLEHCVVLDRVFEGWTEHPLATRSGGTTLTAREWFKELREGYAGPHAAFFKRVVVE